MAFKVFLIAANGNARGRNELTYSLERYIEPAHANDKRVHYSLFSRSIIRAIHAVARVVTWLTRLVCVQRHDGLASQRRALALSSLDIHKKHEWNRQADERGQEPERLPSA